MSDFIKIVDGWGETRFGPNMSWIDTSSRFALDKIARATGVSEAYVPPALRAKIAEIQGTLPRNKVAFYNRALGTHESYGVNKNGDCWRRSELMRKHASFVDGARYFRHHKNKAGIDPDYGRPIASAFNERTDMVDLIILADFDKQAEEDIQNLERGISVPTSMGCRVKYDVCLICANKARHRGEYCEHVKEAAAHPYGMCQVLPDGRVCGVDNPDPEFFDISRVTNPAFVGSENLLKVASSGIIVVSSALRAELVGLMPKQAERAQRSGAVAVTTVKPEPKVKASRLGQKIADMIKEIPGRIHTAVLPSGEKIDAMAPVAARLSARATQVPGDTMTALAKKAGIDRVLSTSAAMGLILSPAEFGVLCGAEVAEPRVEDIVAVKVAGRVLDAAIDAEVARVLTPYALERSFLQPVLLSNMAKVADRCSCKETDKNCGDWKCIGGIPQPKNKKTNKVASDAYIRYRAALLGNLRGDDIAVDSCGAKLAETSARYTTPTSAAFALLAFCRSEPENQDVVSGQFLAKQSSIADTLRCTLRVSGSMADELGEEVMELMADNFLQSTRS